MRCWLTDEKVNEGRPHMLWIPFDGLIIAIEIPPKDFKVLQTANLEVKP